MHRFAILVLALLAQLACSGCGGRPDQLGPLPASFTGEFPCADCPGIRYSLNLFPDGAFYQRLIYIDRPNVF